MENRSRRGFIRTVGAVGALTSVGALGTGTVRASQTTVTGRLVAHDGAPVANRIVKNYGEDGFDVYTDDEGRFSASVTSNSRLMLVLYKGSPRSQLEPDFNGVPHLYTLGDYRAGEGETDLGKLELPKGYRVRMRALDSDSDAVRGATAGVRHDGSGIGNRAITTDTNGWAYLNGASKDGIELAGQVTLNMDIPVDGGGAMSYSEYTTVDEEAAFVFQVGEGVSKVEPETTPTPTPAEEPEPTPTDRSTVTPTDRRTDPPAADPTATATPHDTDRGTRTPALSTETSETETPTTNQRGFLTNGADAEELGPLDDPFLLTVGGFALSVAGIVHNMVRGY